MNKENKIKPFHKWKDEKIEEDSIKEKVFRYIREKDWYWKEYGKYCNKIRERNKNE